MMKCGEGGAKNMDTTDFHPRFPPSKFSSWCVHTKFVRSNFILQHNRQSTDLLSLLS